MATSELLTLYEEKARKELDSKVNKVIKETVEEMEIEVDTDKLLELVALNYKLETTDLGGTIKAMFSDDYKERFKAEYNQLLIRRNKLQNMIDKLLAGNLGFTPDCPTNLLISQVNIMSAYLNILRIRAEIEGIELR